jgi:ribonuclease J
VRVRVLDGARTIGGTKIYLESGASAVLLDFGLNYHQWGLYCEEYLHPRAGRGLHDFSSSGLLRSTVASIAMI